MTAAARNTTVSCTNDMLIKKLPCYSANRTVMLPDRRATDKPAPRD
jgi:hypothetical protein